MIPRDDLVAEFCDSLGDGGWSAREAALSIPDTALQLAWRRLGWDRALANLAAVLLYSHEVVAGRSRDWPRRTPMEVDRMVDRWVDMLVASSAAHSPEAFAAGEHATDDLMAPLLVAPIKQIRAFAAGLAAKLEADERVPFLVWSTFKSAIEPLIRFLPEGEAVALKADLARAIAEATERELPREDLIKAIAGALQWRSGPALERTKAALEAGGKPKIRGRQSCLFLDVLDPNGEQALATVIL